MSKVKVLFSVAKAWGIHHAPELLLAAGAGSFVATVICASRSTLKAQDILIDHREARDDIETALGLEDDNYTEEDAKKDKVTLYTQTSLKIAKTYAIPVGLAALSLACFFGFFPSG